MTIHSGWLFWYTYRPRMVSISGAGVCGVMLKRNMSSLGIYTIVFQAEVFAILACVRDCTERNDPLRHHE
jgi:hypothetical protein